MPKYMLISHHSGEAPEGVEFTPEVMQVVIQKYNDWMAGLMKDGRLLEVNKLLDTDPGKNLTGFGDKQVVTDGPYAETKEIIGGYWIIEAADYDEAVRLASGCTTLEYGGRIEVREVEELPPMG
ncbi:MAG: hypothetical protein IPM66_22900 [Acidobacteriota bacterium]|nr:MAG: hypothetical protein IPM66_22900 [Acidobacteriota bacterium]